MASNYEMIISGTKKVNKMMKKQRKRARREKIFYLLKTSIGFKQNIPYKKLLLEQENESKQYFKMMKHSKRTKNYNYNILQRYLDGIVSIAYIFEYKVKRDAEGVSIYGVAGKDEDGNIRLPRFEYMHITLYLDEDDTIILKTQYKHSLDFTYEYYSIQRDHLEYLYAQI